MTTTDVLKGVAILLVLVDHHGYFFDSANPWWRLFGRVAAPVFFFLIGFARSRRVPWTWLALGAVITGVNVGLAEPMVNILISFALLRGVVLPLVERHVMPRLPAVAALVGVCVVLFPFTEATLEYGTGGWLWAFLGLAHRLALQERTERARWIRNGIAAAAATAYILRETHVFGFTGVQIAILLLLVAGLCTALLGFRRKNLAWQPPAPAAALLRFGGRFTLEIYGITFLASALLDAFLQI